MQQKTKRILVLSAIVTVVVALFIVVISISTSLNDDNSESNMEDQLTTDDTVLFSNDSILIDEFGFVDAQKILNQVKESIVIKTEIASAPSENKTAYGSNFYMTTISDLYLYKTIPQVYKFTATVSDGRVYECYLRYDTEKNVELDTRTSRISTVVKRGDSFKKLTTDAEKDILLQNLQAWADTI